jgi:hypothetical protein
MRLRVKETNGRLHTVEADPQIQFDRFREMVHKLVPGIAPDMQKLVFDGRLLDADTLKATGLKDGGAALVPFPFNSCYWLLIFPFCICICMNRRCPHVDPTDILVRVI